MGSGECTRVIWSNVRDLRVITEKRRQPVHIGLRVRVEENDHVASGPPRAGHACPNEPRALGQVDHSHFGHVLPNVVVERLFAVLCNFFKFSCAPFNMMAVFSHLSLRHHQRGSLRRGWQEPGGGHCRLCAGAPRSAHCGTAQQCWQLATCRNTVGSCSCRTTRMLSSGTRQLANNVVLTLGA